MRSRSLPWPSHLLLLHALTHPHFAHALDVTFLSPMPSPTLASPTTSRGTTNNPPAILEAEWTNSMRPLKIDEQGFTHYELTQVVTQLVVKQPRPLQGTTYTTTLTSGGKIKGGDEYGGNQVPRTAIYTIRADATRYQVHIATVMHGIGGPNTDGDTLIVDEQDCRFLPSPSLTLPSSSQTQVLSSSSQSLSSGVPTPTITPPPTAPSMVCTQKLMHQDLNVLDAPRTWVTTVSGVGQAWYTLKDIDPETIPRESGTAIGTGRVRGGRPGRDFEVDESLDGEGAGTGEVGSATGMPKGVRGWVLVGSAVVGVLAGGLL